LRQDHPDQFFQILYYSFSTAFHQKSAGRHAFQMMRLVSPIKANQYRELLAEEIKEVGTHWQPKGQKLSWPTQELGCGFPVDRI
jgi:hypothetical protein